MSRLDALQAVEARLHLLFVAGLDGDARGYRTFLDELSAHLRGFLRRRLSQAPDDVEDILQETLLAIHNSRHTYRRGEPLTAWVYAVARYKLLDFYRAHARKGPPPYRWTPPPSCSRTWTTPRPTPATRSAGCWSNCRTGTACRSCT